VKYFYIQEMTKKRVENPEVWQLQSLAIQNVSCYLGGQINEIIIGGEYLIWEKV